MISMTISETLTMTAIIKEVTTADGDKNRKVEYEHIR